MEKLRIHQDTGQDEQKFSTLTGRWKDKGFVWLLTENVGRESNHIFQSRQLGILSG